VTDTRYLCNYVSTAEDVSLADKLRCVVLTPGAEYPATAMSLMALLDRVHTERAILPRRIDFLLMYEVSPIPIGSQYEHITLRTLLPLLGVRTRPPMVNGKEDKAVA
jgi:hypothetical protein